MRAAILKTGLALALVLGLSACAGAGSRLAKPAANKSGPDEFLVLPSKPLQTPANYTDLPEPTPGAGNLTDPNPRADAVAALGGNPARLQQSGIPAADGALLAYSARYGVAADIRSVLGAADKAFRRAQGALSIFRWFSKSRYFAAYRGQALDQYQELKRLRAAGVDTPSAPPGP